MSDADRYISDYSIDFRTSSFAVVLSPTLSTVRSEERKAEKLLLAGVCNVCSSSFCSPGSVMYVAGRRDQLLRTGSMIVT